MTNNFKYAQLQPFSLAGSGSALGDTSLVLTTFTDIDGNLLTMSNFGLVGYGTIEPGTLGREEQISFTGVTQNANGTATLTGVSNVLNVSPYTKTSGLLKTHPGGVVFVISNTAGFYNELTSKENDEVIAGTWSFTNSAPSAPAPVAGTDLANKAYVLSVVSGGTVSTDQVNVVGTAGETVVAGNMLYLKPSDGRWWKTDADDSTTTDSVLLGIAQGAGSAGLAVTGGVLVKGTDKNQSGLVAGSLYYISNTAGAISVSAGTNERGIGRAKSTTELYFDPYFYYSPTALQKSLFPLLETFLGDGSDGSATISSGTTTLTKDMFYTSLTVDGTGILNTAGYKIFSKNSVTIDATSGAHIHNNATAGGNGSGGSAAAGGTAGVGGVGGSLPAGLDGKAGADAVSTGVNPGNNGTNGTNSTHNIINAAGAAGGTGGQNGGTAGVGGTSTAANNYPRTILNSYYLFDFTSGTAVKVLGVNSGSGSGSSGGSTANDGGGSGSGGGSGGSGGMVWIACKTLSLTGTACIQAKGANGGNGGASTNHGGGGGGGGGNGGVILAIFASKTGTGTMVVTAGTGGTGGTTTSGQAGTNGANGTVGTVIELLSA